jgi:phospholipid/cholesterol/gamma-HCH transport system substrate-binding protein
MQKSRHDVWVGLFVMVGVAALLFLALKAGNLLAFSFAQTYQVNAPFDNIGGLKPRAPVKSAGVVVGRVEAIGFDDKTFRATVVLALEQQFKFPKDTSAKILTSGLLGEQYVGLEAGYDEKTLVAGDVIKSTQSAVVLENIIGQFLFNKAAEQGGSTAPAPAPAPAPAAPAPKK